MGFNVDVDVEIVQNDLYEFVQKFLEDGAYLALDCCWASISQKHVEFWKRPPFYDECCMI